QTTLGIVDQDRDGIDEKPIPHDLPSEQEKAAAYEDDQCERNGDLARQLQLLRHVLKGYGDGPTGLGRALSREAWGRNITVRGQRRAGRCWIDRRRSPSHAARIGCDATHRNTRRCCDLALSGLNKDRSASA